MSGVAFAPVRIHGAHGWQAGLHARPASGRPTLLLVPPFPHEWQRSYRLFALLSQALAEQGVGSLRFDPTGCGDSSGEDAAFCLDQLSADTRLALAWLRASGERPVLLGVRAGALVASTLAPEQGVAWIAWQAVASGSEYLASLEARERQELHNPNRYGRSSAYSEPVVDCLLGQRVHPQLRPQLRAARLMQSPWFVLDSGLSPALSGWVDEINLATPFPVAKVRDVATALSARLAEAG